ncbi:TetR family transcriptional regulator [bacterium]|nr:TetR family transcriptional regulator [bacterium]
MIDDCDNAPDVRPEPRDVILKAAFDRILHYGYDKTTMAEIAKDADMSAGNIYRFFPSKIDIAEEIARQFNSNVHAAYRDIASDPARSAEQKLRAFFLFRLERTFRLIEDNPKIREMAVIIGRERPAFLAEERAREHVIVESILRQGVDAGEFSATEGPAFAATLVQRAMTKFSYPQLWTNESLSELKHELESLISLLMHGLAVRA